MGGDWDSAIRKTRQPAKMSRKTISYQREQNCKVPQGKACIEKRNTQKILKELQFGNQSEFTQTHEGPSLDCFRPRTKDSKQLNFFFTKEHFSVNSVCPPL